MPYWCGLCVGGNEKEIPIDLEWAEWALFVCSLLDHYLMHVGVLSPPPLSLPAPFWDLPLWPLSPLLSTLLISWSVHVLADCCMSVRVSTTY